MAEPKETILGLIPGMRLIGIAVLVNGRLVRWQVHSFRENATAEKINRILEVIEKYVQQYEVTHLSFKELATHECSPELLCLMQGICSLTERLTLNLSAYSVQELKAHCIREGRMNKATLIDALTEKHPELSFEAKRWKSSQKIYLTKAFEAVACATFTHSELKKCKKKAVR